MVQPVENLQTIQENAEGEHLSILDSIASVQQFKMQTKIINLIRNYHHHHHSSVTFRRRHFKCFTELWKTRAKAQHSQIPISSSEQTLVQFWALIYALSPQLEFYVVTVLTSRAYTVFKEDTTCFLAYFPDKITHFKKNS